MGRFTSWAIMLEGLFHMWTYLSSRTQISKDRATRIGKQIWPKARMQMVETKEGYSSKLQQGKVGQNKT